MLISKYCALLSLRSNVDIEGAVWKLDWYQLAAVFLGEAHLDDMKTASVINRKRDLDSAEWSPNLFVLICGKLLQFSFPNRQPKQNSSIVSFPRFGDGAPEVDSAFKRSAKVCRAQCVYKRSAQGTGCSSRSAEWNIWLANKLPALVTLTCESHITKKLQKGCVALTCK